MQAQGNVVLLVAEGDVRAVKSKPGLGTDIRVFADTDAFEALQHMIRDRPRLVVLGRVFADTERGAALINAIKTDETLADTHVRVLSQASDYLDLVSRREEAGFAPAAVDSRQPPARDYLGTRKAQRFRMEEGVEVRLGGASVTLVDLSRTGAHLVGSIALHPQQRVDISLMGREQDPDMAASVVWVFFEPAREDGPLRYLAGVEFAGADPEIIEAFSVRHRQK